MAGEAGDEVEVPPTLEGAARRPPRPARRGRAAGARARRGRGRGLPPRRRAGARPGGGPGDAAAGRARAPGADPSRHGAVRARGRLPLPPPADPRRRLRRAPEVVAGGAARALRGLAGAARRRAGRAGRDPRLPPRAGRPLPARARTARPDPGRSRRRAARGRRPPRALARRRARRRRAARAGARADPAGAPRRRARARPRRGALSGQPARPQRSPTPPPSGRGRPATRQARRSPVSAPPTTACSSRPIRPSTSWSRSPRTALPLLEQAEDHAGLVHVWEALTWGVANWRCRFEDYAHAVGAGAPPRPAGRPAQVGSLPPRPRARPRAAAGGRGAPHARRAPAREPASLAAADARLAAHHARPLRRGSADRRARPADDGASSPATTRSTSLLGYIAATAGDHESAAVHLRRYCDLLEARGQRHFLSTYAPMLGRSLCALGRHDEAEPLAQLGRELGDDAGHLRAGALAAGAGARPREPRPARAGGGPRPRGRRDHGTARTR